MSVDRYHHHSILPEVGTQGQLRLAQSRVLCVGAGGLGCAALPYLAGAGIGRITVIDNDRVDRSNLQRQTLFAESDEGRLKAEAAVERLSRLNGDIDLVAECVRLGPDNVERFLGEHNVVVDGSDNFATKYLLADASVKCKVPVVYGSVTGFEAQVTVFDPGHGPCLRCLFPQAPDTWVPNCAEAGVLGPLVGIAGCIQAAEAIKLILAGGDSDGRFDSLAGRLWVIDARGMQSRQFRFARRENCPLCSRNPLDIILGDRARGMTQPISATEAATLHDAVFLDVREADEYHSGHIPGAMNLPLSRLHEGSPALPADRPCVVYCTHGRRSDMAVRVLQQAGARDVRSLQGGIVAWRARLDAGSLRQETSGTGATTSTTTLASAS